MCVNPAKLAKMLTYFRGYNTEGESTSSQSNDGNDGNDPEDFFFSDGRDIFDCDQKKKHAKPNYF